MSWSLPKSTPVGQERTVAVSLSPAQQCMFGEAYPEFRRGKRVSDERACLVALNRGVNILVPFGDRLPAVLRKAEDGPVYTPNRCELSGRQRSTSVVRSPLSRSQRRDCRRRTEVSSTRRWFQGTCGGTLSRLGVVWYGLYIRKPRCVSSVVGKKTTHRESLTGWILLRSGSRKKAIST